MDQSSKRLVDNVVKEDDILNENITRASLPTLQSTKLREGPRVDQQQILS